jgi:hypothetical protein
MAISLMDVEWAEAERTGQFDYAPCSDGAALSALTAPLKINKSEMHFCFHLQLNSILIKYFIVQLKFILNLHQQNQDL